MQHHTEGCQNCITINIRMNRVDTLLEVSTLDEKYVGSVGIRSNSIRETSLDLKCSCFIVHVCD
jgi:hypothetical protein